MTIIDKYVKVAPGFDLGAQILRIWMRHCEAGTPNDLYKEFVANAPSELRLTNLGNHPLKVRGEVLYNTIKGLRLVSLQCSPYVGDGPLSNTGDHHV